MKWVLKLRDGREEGREWFRSSKENKYFIFRFSGKMDILKKKIVIF